MSKSILCKSRCIEVARVENGETIKLAAVSGKENEPWSKWTPSSQFTVFITNPNAFGCFEPGRNYLLEISEAPAEQP